MFYKAWSLYFLRNFNEIETHLREIIEKNNAKDEISIENFYDFYFLLGVYLIENNCFKIEKIEKFEEARKYLLDFLSRNQRSFSEQDPVTLTDEIYSYDIDEMKTQKR